MEIIKKINIVNLYDIYYSLLTKRQQEIFELIFDDDYSVSEVAEVLKITSAGVSKTIKEITEKLEEFENKLEINKKYQENIKLLKENKINPNIIGRIKK